MAKKTYSDIDKLFEKMTRETSKKMTGTQPPKTKKKVKKATKK